MNAFAKLKTAFGLALIGLLVALMTGCATNRSYDYTAFRAHQPKSILVLPPLNNSPDVRATYSVLSTVTYPIAEAGYYVFPVALVDQTFKENGLTQPADMHQASAKKLVDIFGADAALYITVEQYGASYKVLSSAVIVSAKATLIDLRSGKTLWTGAASASSEEGNNQQNNGGLLGALLTSIIKQAIHSMGDQGHGIAQITSDRLFQAHPNGGWLYGPRSPLFGQEAAKK